MNGLWPLGSRICLEALKTSARECFSQVRLKQHTEKWKLNSQRGRSCEGNVHCRIVQHYLPVLSGDHRTRNVTRWNARCSSLWTPMFSLLHRAVQSWQTLDLARLHRSSIDSRKLCTALQQRTHSRGKCYNAVTSFTGVSGFHKRYP